MNLGTSKSSKLFKIERLFFNLLALSKSSETLEFYLGVPLRDTIQKSCDILRAVIIIILVLFKCLRL